MDEREISYTKDAARALLRMPRNHAQRIVGKIEQLARDPASLANNVTALKGSPFSRLRVGDYRVIFSADLRVLAIVAIGQRGSIYE